MLRDKNKIENTADGLQLLRYYRCLGVQSSIFYYIMF
jgi:hypothetical protein